MRYRKNSEFKIAINLVSAPFDYLGTILIWNYCLNFETSIARNVQSGMCSG